MLQNVLSIIFIILLIITSLLFVALIIYVFKLIKISTKLKAKQYIKFNEFAQKHKVMFVGDSLTEFYQLDEFFHKEQVYNRGIASDTTDGVLERLEDNVLNIEPSKVFLQIGTNDFNKRSIEYIFNNIIKIISIIKERLSDTKIYLISLYPVNHKAKKYSRFFTQKRKNANIIILNKKLAEYCNEINIPYIDVYSKLIDENGHLDKKYTIEGLHINFEGYTVITNILHPYVIE